MSSVVDCSPGKPLSVCCPITGEVLYTLPDITVAINGSNAPVTPPNALPTQSGLRATLQPARCLLHPSTNAGAEHASAQQPKQLAAQLINKAVAASQKQWDVLQQELVERFLTARKLETAEQRYKTFPNYPTAEYWKCIATPLQQRFLQLYNSTGIPFPSDRVLHQTATNSGIGIATALSLHLAYELSYIFCEWLKKRCNQPTKHLTTDDCKQPACFAKLYKYFKKRFPECHTAMAQSLIATELKQRSAANKPVKLVMQKSGVFRSKPIGLPKALQNSPKRVRKPKNVKQPSLRAPTASPAPQQPVLAKPVLAVKRMANKTLNAFKPLNKYSMIVAHRSAIDICGENLPKCKNMRTYCCHHCCLHTNNPRMYLLHLRDVHGSRNTIYMCPCCQYATKRSNEFVRHLQALHRFGEEQAFAQKPLSTLPYDGIGQRLSYSKPDE